MKRFLVVEDEEALRSIYQEELSYFFENCHVDLAGDGVEALKLISTNKYDLIITDGRMPNMGGLEMTSRLRQKNYDVPIILITGFTDDMDIESNRKLFTMIKEKPVDLDDFINDLKGFIANP